jgi:hypothetical protein
MPKGQKPTRYRRLEDAGEDALRVIHQHRLVTTSQLHSLVLPDHSLRRMQAVLSAMEARGLVAAATGRRPWPGQAESAWFLTRRGAAAAEEPDAAEPRRRLLTPDQAAGPLQGHTLAVNEVGVAFTRAARECGHELGVAEDALDARLAGSLRTAPEPEDGASGGGGGLPGTLLLLPTPPTRGGLQAGSRGGRPPVKVARSLIKNLTVAGVFSHQRI